MFLVRAFCPLQSVPYQYTRQVWFKKNRFVNQTELCWQMKSDIHFHLELVVNDSSILTEEQKKFMTSRCLELRIEGVLLAPICKYLSQEYYAYIFVNFIVIIRELIYL